MLIVRLSPSRKPESGAQGPSAHQKSRHATFRSFGACAGRSPDSSVCLPPKRASRTSARSLQPPSALTDLALHGHVSDDHSHSCACLMAGPAPRFREASSDEKDRDARHQHDHVPIQVAWRYRNFMPASVRRVPASPGMKYLDSAC
jgi:hypothetical protein